MGLMEPIQNPVQVPIPQTKSNHLIIIVFSILGIIFLVSIIFLFFQNQQLEKKLVSQQVSPTIQIPSPTPSLIVKNDNWGNFSQEFMNGYTFEVLYPLDKEHTPFIFNSKDSGWPISALEQLFTTNIAFGDYHLGISDTDPTSCYKDLCKSAIDEITKNDEVLLNNISSRKIKAIINSKGGGVILPGKPSESILYIIPYQNKFIVLYSFYPDSGFEEFVSSFKVQHN